MCIKNRLFIIFLFSNMFLFAQNLSIIGKVFDVTTNEYIFNAKVFIASLNKGVTSDINGDFSFYNLAPGKYTLEIKASTYINKVVEVNVLKSSISEISIALDPVFKQHQNITIKKKINTGTDIGLMQIQKSSLVVLDGIPAELIKKSPDRTVGDALKRISGASIQDNKFAVIRGLNDRYNAAYLNGAPLPSSEGDRKAFAFDIFPVNMLENLTILKTASPDLPAEFAGGIIQVKTKDIPTENFQSISLGAGYNTITTFKDKKIGIGGKTDWLGIDDGTRSIPSVIPSSLNFPTLLSDQADLAKKFITNWGIKTGLFMPNLNIQYTGGLKKRFSETREFGFIGSVSYNRINNYNETVRRSYTDNAAGGIGASQIETDYLDKTYSNQTLAGIMGNFAFKINNANSISLKNMYSINSDNRYINRTGEVNPLEINPTLLKSNANWFTSNQIFSSQLNGNHVFKEGKFKLDWTGSISNIQRNIPNLRRSVYTRLKDLNDPTNPNPYDTMYVANISETSVGTNYGGGMFFSTNKESIYSSKVNLIIQLKDLKQMKTELKMGGFTQFRNRNFIARQFGYTMYGVSGGNVSFNQNLLYLPEDSIFRPENMGLISPGVGGFKLSEGTKPSDSYSANSSLYASYISFLNQWSNLKLLYGARLENFNQNLDAIKADKTELHIRQHNLDILPSFNFIYSPNQNQNIRLCGSQTLNRPEYRELAPFAFFDFNTLFVLSGNDSLKRAKISNLDLRYEYYSGNGQMLSATVFYKYFTNPIEQIARPDVMNEISYKNVGNASNYGLELETKIVFGKLLKRDSTSFLNNLNLFSNLGIIRSIVDVSMNIGTPYKSRPLQGQSPYVFNCGLNYQTQNNFSVSLNVNRVGPRIYILGSLLQPDIWEKSRTFLDLQISKSFLKNKLEIKLNCQNLLAQNLIFYQNNYGISTNRSVFNKLSDVLFTGDKSGESKYNSSVDDLVWSTKYGRTFSFVITYKF